VTKIGLIKEEVKKNKDEFDQTLKPKADNYSLRMENGFGQDKKEPVLIVNPGSGGGSTGKDWETLFARIKEGLVRNHISCSLKNLEMELLLQES
jgi:hypothetical protein